jgi:hypothetical protein
LDDFEPDFLGLAFRGGLMMATCFRGACVAPGIAILLNLLLRIVGCELREALDSLTERPNDGSNLPERTVESAFERLFGGQLGKLANQAKDPI